MALDSGKKIVRRTWDVIPMSDTVIARVNKLAADQPELLIFTDRKGRTIGDSSEPHVEITGVDEEESQAPQAVDEPDDEVFVDPDSDLADIQVEPEEPLMDVGTPEPGDEPGNEPAPADSEMEPDIQQEAPLEAPEASVEAPAASPGVRRSTRAKVQYKESYVPSMTGKTYNTSAAQVETVKETEEDEVLHPDAHMMFLQHEMEERPNVVEKVMTQLSLKAGLKAWGEKGADAAKAELKQIHLRDTFQPKHFRELTSEQKVQILESHLFLKEKRDGTIKGRQVAGGNKQRGFISKEDASSKTVSTEAVLLTCTIDAEEDRDVAVIDIPNAFIQTRVEDVKDMAVIRLRGAVVDMLLEVAPGIYDDYVTLDRKGNKQLIVVCSNAIYGTMVASLLYYKKFVKTLLREGFKINPYDCCVANRMVKGKQQTVTWHVDDCKLSCFWTKANDKLIETFRREYETIFEDGSGKMKVTRGKVHDYLGMRIDFTVRGQVEITMIPFLCEIVAEWKKDFPEMQGCHKATAAPSHLFSVNDDAKPLKQGASKKFHKLVAKMLFATKSARPDTGTAESFLTTRVKGPDVDDLRKLSHMMRYIEGTIELPLILRANGSGMLKWWIDESHGVHPALRGHTGGGLTMGRGFPIAVSSKQKLNTRSSTETEVVGVDDLMPSILWTRLFLESQGYGVRENIIYQDNQAAMLLEKNGKASSGKRTKHLEMRYFFVTDRVRRGDVSVEWCPTEDMTGDFLTKPLQGASFVKFRDLIMGVKDHPDPGPGKSKAEPVGLGKSKKSKPK